MDLCGCFNGGGGKGGGGVCFRQSLCFPFLVPKYAMVDIYHLYPNTYTVLHTPDTLRTVDDVGDDEAVLLPGIR